MKKNYIYLLALILFSGCQFYMDPRNEPLMLITEEEWSELSTIKETNFEIEPDPVQAPPELPGSEDIGFIELDNRDVVRHEVVRKIINAYEEKNRN